MNQPSGQAGKYRQIGTQGKQRCNRKRHGHIAINMHADRQPVQANDKTTQCKEPCPPGGVEAAGRAPDAGDKPCHGAKL